MIRTMDGAQPTPARSAEDAKREIVADFRASMGELRCLGSERMVRLGISMSQLHVMHLLEQHDEMPTSRLAEMLGISLSNATGLIDRVEERGYVERMRVPADRRVVLVRITAGGRAVLEEAEDVRASVFERILDQLDGGQLDRLAVAMSDLHGAITTALADPAMDVHHGHESQGRG